MMKMMSVMSQTDLLSHALLCMPDGPDLAQAVANIHRYLVENGARGHRELKGSLESMVYLLLRREMEEIHGAERPWSLELIDRFEALWEDLQERAVGFDQGAVQDHVRIGQCVDFLCCADTEQERREWLEELERALFTRDKLLLKDGKDHVEQRLTEMLADKLEQQANPSPQLTRALALRRFLGEKPVIDRPLSLLSCHHGEFFLLTPENVHTLNGKQDGRFLKKELDRLARELPMFSFLQILGQMSSVEHPHDTVADGVLDSLCGEYQAMLSPVG